MSLTPILTYHKIAPRPRETIFPGTYVAPAEFARHVAYLTRRHATTTLGDYLGEELPRMADRHPSIGDIRGKGLFFGLELVKNRETREPLVPFNAGGEAAAPVTRMAKAAMERGLYLFVHWNVVIVAPPLTITREELDEGLGVLDEVLAIADEHAA